MSVSNSNKQQSQQITIQINNICACISKYMHACTNVVYTDQIKCKGIQQYYDRDLSYIYFAIFHLVHKYNSYASSKTHKSIYHLLPTVSGMIT